MPKKKPKGKPAAPASKPLALPPIIAQIKRAGVALALLVLIVIAAGVAARYYIPRVSPIPPKAPPVKHRAVRPKPEKPRTPAPKVATPRYEIYPKEKPPPIRRVSPPRDTPIVRPGKLPEVAIIIDDMGYDRKMTRKILSLKAGLTYSILPFSPGQDEILAAARKNGQEIMLHLPMEPTEYPLINPGPGALLTTMTPDELTDQLKKNIRSIPGIKGVNNHMGSRMTEISVQMYQIFTVLKKEGLFFVDSRTTAATLCKPSARLLRVPFAERDVFLDHVQEVGFVRSQIRELIQVATENGKAIGIGHPHPVTYRVLRDMLPELRKKVTIVPASRIVHILG